MQIVVLGMALVFVYCGSDWQPQASGLAGRGASRKERARRRMVWFFEHARIFSNAGEGIVHQVTHSIRGHGVYILGQTDARSLWYYFPAALSIKLTEPLLLAPLLLLAVRARSLCNWAVWCAAAMLLFSLNAKVQIGVRLVLPLVALGVVGVSAAAVDTVTSPPASDGAIALLSSLRRRRPVVGVRFLEHLAERSLLRQPILGRPGGRRLSGQRRQLGLGTRTQGIGSMAAPPRFGGVGRLVFRCRSRFEPTADAAVASARHAAGETGGCGALRSRPARGGQRHVDPRLPDLRRRRRPLASRRSSWKRSGP